MSAIGTDRLCGGVHKHFRCWRQTGGAAARPILLSLTRSRLPAFRSSFLSKSSRTEVPGPARHDPRASVIDRGVRQ